jgi:hypothetical protein
VVSVVHYQCEPLVLLQLWTSKAHLFCGHRYSYSGHDRNTSGGSEMLENIYLEYIEGIAMGQSP